MASIPKIVLTPVKWASKQALNRTLLRFPGGDPKSSIACVYCPEMCRFSCPSAVVSGNDAVTPSNKMSLVYQEKTWPGQAAQGNELWPIYDCTGCGRCTSYCVYEIPVAERLWEARKEHSWEEAKHLLRTISDEQDPWGDLADELGDSVLAKTRAQKWVKSSFGKRKGGLTVDEPKALYFLLQEGVSATLSWDEVFGVEFLESQRGRSLVSELLKVQQKFSERFPEKGILIAESVWLSRRLKRHAEVAKWVESLRSRGVRLIEPFENGMDALDQGGEGAYRLLFPQSAKGMALDFWNRDSHRSAAVLTWSNRGATHLRSVLSEFGVEVISVAELAFPGIFS